MFVSMLRRISITLASLVFALSVLGTSIFRTTQPDFAFSGTPAGQVQGVQSSVDYYLPYPGILPDSVLWPLKALRDRVWLFVTRDPVRRAELLLLFADKRVGMAKALIEGGKTDIGVSTATKAEKYLEQALLQEKEAAKRGADTNEFLEKLSRASLKHLEILDSLAASSQGESQMVLQDTISYPERIYQETVQRLEERGISVEKPEESDDR